MQFGEGTNVKDRTHQQCVEAFGVDWNEILQCVGSEFASRQQLAYEQITSRFKIFCN